MTVRPPLIVSGVVALVVIATVGYFSMGDRGDNRKATESDQSLSATSGGSVQSTNTDAQSAAPNGDTRGPAAENESIETLMGEIEQNAGGDDMAMENELAGESESFMEGAVVMEQLGQSYDETSY